MNEVAFHEHFIDSEACYVAAFEDALTRLRSRIEDAIWRREDWSEQVRAAMWALLGMLDDEPSLARLVFVQSPEDPPAIVTRRAQTVEEVVKLVDRGREQAHPLIDPSPDAAARLVNTVLTFIEERLLSPNPAPMVEMYRPLASMVVLSYTGA